MPSKLFVTDQDYQPLSAFVTFFNSAGGENVQPISKNGTVLNEAYLSASDTIEVWADGYYSFATGSSALVGDVTVTLDKKPASVTKYLIIGALAGYLFSKL